MISLLGEKAANLLVNLDATKYENYEEVKKIVLREFQPSARKCLENFKRARRNVDETFTQYITRITAAWDHYIRLRGVSDAEGINQLIIADKVLETRRGNQDAHLGQIRGNMV